MGHASPFQTSTFQEFFNDIKKSSIQWVLTHAIALWAFKSPLKLQFPKWEFTCECEGSFPHTLLHFREHAMWLPGPVLARTFANPCFGHEPKAKVMTYFITWLWYSVITHRMFMQGTSLGLWPYVVDIWDGILIKCFFMLAKLNNLKINKNWWTDV